MAIQILDASANVLANYSAGQVVSFDGISFLTVDGDTCPSSIPTEKGVCITHRDGITHTTGDYGANWS
jgi:hypothetical protein